MLWSKQLLRLQNFFKDGVFEASKLVSTKTLLLKHYYRRQGCNAIHNIFLNQVWNDSRTDGFSFLLWCTGDVCEPALWPPIGVFVNQELAWVPFVHMCGKFWWILPCWEINQEPLPIKPKTPSARPGHLTETIPWKTTLKNERFSNSNVCMSPKQLSYLQRFRVSRAGAWIKLQIAISPICAPHLQISIQT